MGINTKAPEMRIMRMSGPSILGVEVRTRKQRAVQQRVRMTHWVWLSGFLIVNQEIIHGGTAGKEVCMFFLVAVPPCGLMDEEALIALFSSFLRWHRCRQWR